MNCFHGGSQETFQEAPVLQRQSAGVEEEEFAHFLLGTLLSLMPAEPFLLGRHVPHVMNLNLQPPKSPSTTHTGGSSEMLPLTDQENSPGEGSKVQCPSKPQGTALLQPTGADKNLYFYSARSPSCLICFQRCSHLIQKIIRLQECSFLA